MRGFQGGCHGAILVHGKFAGSFCLVGVDLPGQPKMKVDGFPEGGFLLFFAFAADVHFKAFDGLALLFEDRYDIDAAASSKAHQEHLHRADAKIFAAGFRVAVHSYRMSCCVCGLESKIPIYPVEMNLYHAIKIFAKLRRSCTYFASKLRNGFMNYFTSNQPFLLEGGGALPAVTVAYHTYGRLNADKSNVVWVCHALTANSDVAGWWPGVVGAETPIDPEKYFIVCANILGSCYGSSGPLTEMPGNRIPGEPGRAAVSGSGDGADSVEPGEPYYSRFPQLTIRDMVRAHILLREHLGIEKIYLLMGGSMGGYQALEWCVMEKDLIGKLFLIATSPAESAWGIAIHTAQRLAIEADCSWRDFRPDAGAKGLKAARAIGMLTYRNYNIMVQKQTDHDSEKLDGFKASSYINHQGDKLVERFNVFSYWILTKALDSHNLARGRGGDLNSVLKSITQETLLIGVTSDILCPLAEQRHMAEQMPNATLKEIDSVFGHDGFIVEGKKIGVLLGEWMMGS